MATLEQLEAAFIKADDAGNTEDAQAFANEIRRLRAGQPSANQAGPLDANDARALRTDPQASNLAGMKASMGDPLSDATKFAVGAGKGAVGTSQLIGRMFSPVEDKIAQRMGYSGPIPQDQEWLLEQIKRTEQILNPKGGFDPAIMAGEVMNPVGLKITKAMGPAKGVPQRMKQGAVFGGAQAATQPVMEGDFPTEKATQVGIGAALGAVIPGGIDLAKWAGRSVRDLTGYVFGSTKTAERIAKKYANEIVGPENLQKIVADIEEQLAKGGGESKIALGYRPTVAELAAHLPTASPLQALQKGTGSTAQGISGQFGQRALEQEQALKNALRPIAGTKEQLENALRTAKENAAENYGRIMPLRVSPESDVQAMQQAVANRLQSRDQALQQYGQMATQEAENVTRAGNWFPVPGMPRVSGQVSAFPERASEAAAGAAEAKGISAFRKSQADQLERLTEVLRGTVGLEEKSLYPLLNRPSIQRALKAAQEGAAEKGEYFPKEIGDDFTVANLHRIKLALDDVLNRPQGPGTSALDKTVAKEVVDTRKAFVQWLASKVPDYGKAKMRFSQDMTPVNRMQVGQALENKLFGAPADQMNPGAYLRMIDDETKTVKNVLGQPRSDFGQVFDPRQQATIDEIGGLLERKLSSTKPLQPTVLSGTDIASEATGRLPSVMSTPVVLANWILKTMTSKSSPLERKVDAINAQWLLNPESFVEALKTMPPTQAQQIMQMLQKQGVSPMQQGLIAPSVYAAQNALRGDGEPTNSLRQ